MSDKTKIEWAHSTLNLWYGCTQISPACDHCYAMRTVHRLKLGVVWNGPPVKAIKERLAKIVAWHKGAARFVKRHGERRRVFINSMSDFFDKLAPQEWRDEAFLFFEEATGVDILLVTKRPQNIHKMVPKRWMEGGWPPHIWLIVTAENEEEAERRGATVFPLREKAAIKVVGASIEPMLEHINHGLLLWADWLIIGGESGGKFAREFKEIWARGLLALTRNTGQRFFFKQTRNKGPIAPDLLVREFPI